MAYRLEPTIQVGRELHRVARERLDDALYRLDSVTDATEPAELEEVVHEVRKRCKEVRALARLVRGNLGAEFGRFNGLVRGAALELASIRDAHAVLATFDDLRAATETVDDEKLSEVRRQQAALADDASRGLRSGDPRIVSARTALTKARRRVKKWDVPEGFGSLAPGLRANYRRGRREMAFARKEPRDNHIHEWRKAVKNLWYQTRLLELAAPSVLTPLVARLDDLAEALGDDHDLAVLVERLENDPAAFGGKKAVKRAVRLARAQQQDLRARAFRLGATVYAERPDAFVARIATYWKATLTLGPEVIAGGIAELAQAELEDHAAVAGDTVERERKFLIADPPDLEDAGTEMRQGYLAIDGSVSVRVRDAGSKGCTLTVKAGAGAVRTELEWPLSRRRFDAAWDLTKGRRVHKVRYHIPLDDHVVELDVFTDELDGLIVAEVEFESDEALASFVPPPWFGRDVTDDLRYTNAGLAVDGLHASFFT